MQDELIYKLNMLKARFSYYATKNQYGSYFEKVVIELINAVKNSPEKIFILRDFFEAIIAFHKQQDKNNQNNENQKQKIGNPKQVANENAEQLDNEKAKQIANDIIKDETGDKLIDYAEKIAKSLSKNINTNQLRKIFEEVKKIELSNKKNSKEDN